MTPAVTLLFLLALQPDRDLDDEALARRIREGDEAAFRMFFERYHERLHGYLRRRGIAQAMADDLVQQAYVLLWEKRQSLEPGRSIRSLLFTIAHNRALNHFRDTRRFDDSAEPTDRAIRAPSPEESTSFSLLRQHLDDAIERLPERRRAVFELCFMQQLTYRETAEVLGISVKTVEHQMGHAYKALRKALAAYRT